MNYINIKQVGNLQQNLNDLSDSIYQTGQFLIGINEGTQTFVGQKTFDDEVFFNDGVRVYGELTGQGAIFNESVVADAGVIISGNYVPSVTNVPGSVGSPGNPGEIAFTNEHLYVCTGTDAWARAEISGWA